jgi:uncharacterized membrane protein
VNSSQNSSDNPSTTSIPELAAGLLGGALIGGAAKDGSGRVARMLGLALLGVAARRPLEEALRDLGDRRRQVVMRSSIDIERSVADVFAFLNDFENFPLVVGNLRSVTDYQDGRAHWEAYTPSGHLVEWDTVITKYVPRSVIAWESTANSEVRMNSLVRFTVLSPTRTRVDLETAYCPPRTGVHDAVRSLFGPAQEKRLQADLIHARYYLESLAPKAPPVPDETPANLDAQSGAERDASNEPAATAPAGDERSRP